MSSLLMNVSSPPLGVPSSSLASNHGDGHIITNMYSDQVFDLERGNNLAYVSKPQNDWNTVDGEIPSYAATDPKIVMRETAIPFFMQWPLFWFPFNTNEWTARFVSFQVFGLAILGIITRNDRWNWYLWCGIFGDYTLRFIFGGRGSFLGALAEIPAHFLPKNFVPGAPKQFAAFCGMIFSGGTALAFFEEHGEQDNVGGSIIVGILLFCTASECFFNFCVGCFCFTLANRFGLISDDFRLKASVTLNEYNLMRWEAEEDRKPRNESSQKKFVHSHPLEGSNGRSLSYSYTYRSDAEKRGDFDLIRHCKVYYFSAPMGILGLAISWKVAAEASPFGAHTAVWHGLAVVSAIVFGSIFILYATRAILYPRKLANDWQHPINHFYISLIPICILLFIPLTVNDYKPVAEILFWISGPTILFISALSFLRLILWQLTVSHLTPAIMFPALGNLIGAFTLPSVHPSYTEVGFLWFSIAAFFWVVLTAVTLQRLITGASLLDSVRVSLWIYLAAPAVVCASYLTLNGGIWDAFALSTFYIAIMFFIMLFLLSLTAYFGRDRFNMSYWGYLFPMTALTLICHLYNAYRDIPTVQGVTTVIMVLTNSLAAVLLANTLLALTKKTIFIPDEKFTPLGMFRLEHRAVEAAFVTMTKLLEQQGLNTPESIAQFRTLLTGLTFAQEEHAKHEEYLIFPHFRSLWPGLPDRAHEQHEAMESTDTLGEILNELNQFVREGAHHESPILEKMKQQLASYIGGALSHMKFEEDVLAVPGKYITAEEAKTIVRGAFFYTPLYKWRHILHFQMTAEWHYGRKVKYLKSFTVALPDKIQLIGKLLYESVDAFTFQRLCVDVPELAPRNAQHTVLQQRSY